MWPFSNYFIIGSNLLRLTTRFSSNSLNRSIIMKVPRTRLSTVATEKRNDMEDLFLDNRVRYLLKALTGYDPMRVFPVKSLDNLNSPKYRFMTDEQLKMETEQADQRAESILEMPPVKYPEEQQPRVLEKDIFLQGFLDPSIKLVFMDATPGFTDNERLIAVREADGTLREATRDERHRTNQIFYPVEERKIEYPKMFEDPHLTAMMDRGAYKLLLDSVCLHFEPEDPRHVNLCHQAYDHIASTNRFHLLWSTRHYGAMVFYYVFNKKADSLLHYLLESQKLNEAYNLLCLYYVVNPNPSIESKALDRSYDQTSIVKIHQVESSKSTPVEDLIYFLKIYIKNDSNLDLKSRLELFLQKILSENCKDKNVAKN